jgi:hypothetical protein
LHILEKESKKTKYIKKLQKLNKGEKIIQMCSSSGFLWLITDERLYKIDYKSGKTTIIFSETDSVAGIKTGTGLDFKSIAYYHYKDKGRLLLGSRKYAYVITDPDEQPIPSLVPITLSGKEASDLYVTDIYVNTHLEKPDIYFSTLNKGLFRYDMDKNNLEPVDRSGMNDMGSVRKMVDKDGQMILYSSKGIYRMEYEGAFHLLSDSLHKSISSIRETYRGIFLIGYHGVGSMIIQPPAPVEIYKKISSIDISFTDAAITNERKTEGGYNLLLGSQTGFYRYYYRSGHSESIEIAEKSTTFRLSDILVLVILATIGGILYWLNYFKNKNQGKQKNIDITEKAPSEKLDLLKEIEEYITKEQKPESLNIVLNEKIPQLYNYAINTSDIYKKEINNTLEKIKQEYEKEHWKAVKEECGKLWELAASCFKEQHKWNQNKQIVACMYLACKGIKPNNFGQLLTNSNKYISDLRDHIYEEMKNLEGKRNFLQEELYNRTKPD